MKAALLRIALFAIVLATTSAHNNFEYNQTYVDQLNKTAELNNPFPCAELYGERLFNMTVHKVNDHEVDFRVRSPNKKEGCDGLKTKFGSYCFTGLTFTVEKNVTLLVVHFYKPTGRITTEYYVPLFKPACNAAETVNSVSNALFFNPISRVHATWARTRGYLKHYLTWFNKLLQRKAYIVRRFREYDTGTDRVWYMGTPVVTDAAALDELLILVKH